MQRAFILIITLHLVLVTAMFAQVDTTLWVRRYNGSGNGYDGTNAYGPCMTIDNSGNIYVTGTSYVTGQGQNFILIKYDQNGNQLWTADYNGPANGEDGAWSVTTDGSGNVYITGPSQGTGLDSADYATIKYNSSGDTQWVRRYNGTGNSTDIARQIKVDNSGNIYVTGYSRGSGTGEDFATVKYNSSGVQQWVARYNRLNLDDRAFTIVVDNLGNVYVGGFSNNGVNPDFTLIKYDSLGGQVWIRSYNGNGTDEIKAMILDGSGNIYATGNSVGTTLPGPDILTIKYSPAGDTAWTRRYNYANDYDKATDITLDDSGYVYVAGRSVGFGTDRDYVLLKYNPNSGDTVWTRRYNGMANGYDGACWVTVDQLGNSYITGRSIGTGTAYDYATVKYNSAGDEQWVMRYDGTANDSDIANCVVVDNSGNVYVTGESYGGASNFDIVTIKYGIPAPQPLGWATMAPIPTENSGKNPKSGSCMAGNEGTGRIYFLKASNTLDFHIYTINPTGLGTWATESFPLSEKPNDGKKPKKGASMASYGNAVYVLRGNNTPGFWKYKVTPAESTGWSALTPITTGAKNPKDASGMVVVNKGVTPNDSDYLFVMKGSKTSEFYLFNLESNTWSAALTPPPTGTSGKEGYKKGSCLAYDETNKHVYVLKGQHGDLFRYDLEPSVPESTWLELTRYDYKVHLNREGKKKKIGEGSGLIFTNDKLYLLKGGNTREMWVYGPTSGAGTWTQLETLWDIPIGPTGKKRVKGGGALLNFGGFFWASKGNNTTEFYRHGLPSPTALAVAPSTRTDGAMGKNLTTTNFKLTIAPNPAINVTAVRYSLPVAGPISFKLYNVAGAVVKTYANTTPTKDGVLMLDTKTLPSGVYILRFNSGDIRVTRKLVFEK